MPAMGVFLGVRMEEGPRMNESERALSDGFPWRRRDSGRARRRAWEGAGWSSSLYYGPCSPLARDDTVGSPLQASIDAHAARDGLSLRVPRPRAGRQRRIQARRRRQVDRQCVVVPLLRGRQQQQRGRRQQSASSSPDGTTVAPSSWLSGADGDGGGGLFDACTAQPGSTTVDAGHTRRGFDAESDGDGYANARAGERERAWAKADTWHAARRALSTENARSLPTACGAASVTACDEGPWFQRRRTTTPREYDREPSLVPSFYSEGGPPSLANDGNNNSRNGGGHSLTGMRSALRRRYVAVSYKVRLAVFRTERTVGRKLSRRRRRMGEKEEGGDV
ncbi:hypothetical protein BJ912DRAFT_932751 [Pholiota molesta]|nr:hypothetical protein BJ912DRAFT_932751 [Pholiota molesta]